MQYLAWALELLLNFFVLNRKVIYNSCNKITFSFFTIIKKLYKFENIMFLNPLPKMLLDVRRYYLTLYFYRMIDGTFIYSILGCMSLMLKKFRNFKLRQPDGQFNNE